jgi:hypothetical protein
MNLEDIMFEKFMKTGNPKDYLYAVGELENEDISFSSRQSAPRGEQQNSNPSDTEWQN